MPASRHAVLNQSELLFFPPRLWSLSGRDTRADSPQSIEQQRRDAAAGALLTSA
ncbi:hypothetical protein SBA5_170010 [Candidatus Sulfotelmatomonas gaucii]|uniref:Uncharacterized protein n=1 Tax=Candidatus Sulfuritelmatomonas gaucii TaxID=2043161 RepID=A0A2N9L673_9BACT|nr:hypothetical protein SBA5_170010 [Candidatus Sulfotelmatomonas gaucii]